MDINLEAIRAFFAADRFAALVGVTIDAVGEDGVECGMAITADHFNSTGGVQGGAIFTLADLTFAVHSNLCLLRGEAVGVTVGQSCAISYFKSPKGSRLIARSTCLSHGKTMSVYRIEVMDDLGNAIAEMHGNGFTTGKKPRTSSTQG
ncbi:MAG: PaaI family thioesterase [Desulfobulbaceae bacterium]|nr:PaaI family thioesterase [Desulfobulbaceae bacterium]